MADLEGVIIGGLIGIAGGVIGPLVIEWRKHVHAKQDKRREKLEELVSVIYEHHYWVQRLYEINVKGATREMLLSPFAKLEAITHIYFPQFDTPLNNFARAATIYQGLILGAAPVLKQLDLSKEAHVPIHNDFLQAKADYQRCGNIFLDELKAYAKREFQ
jgi:hypothetical protein